MTGPFDSSGCMSSLDGNTSREELWDLQRELTSRMDGMWGRYRDDLTHADSREIAYIMDRTAKELMFMVHVRSRKGRCRENTLLKNDMICKARSAEDSIGAIQETGRRDRYGRIDGYELEICQRHSSGIEGLRDIELGWDPVFACASKCDTTGIQHMDDRMSESRRTLQYLHEVEMSMRMGSDQTPVRNILWRVLTLPESDLDHRLSDVLLGSDRSDVLYCLGILHATGIGVDRDLDRALEIFGELRNKGMSDAVLSSTCGNHTEESGNSMELMLYAHEISKNGGSPGVLEKLYGLLRESPNGNLSDNAFHILIQFAETLDGTSFIQSVKRMISSDIQWSDEKLLSLYNSCMKRHADIHSLRELMSNNLKTQKAIKTYQKLMESYDSSNDTDVLFDSLCNEDVIEHIVIQRIRDIRIRELDLDRKQTREYTERIDTVCTMFPKYNSTHMVRMYL